MRVLGGRNKSDFFASLHRRFSVGAGLLLLVATIGCSFGEPGLPPPTDTSMLRGIVRTYAIASRDLRRPPQNLDELKAVVAPVAEDPSIYFRSTRDGQDFVVAWGLQLNSVPPGTIVAFERSGADGKRMAVTADGNLREIPDEEFAQLNLTSE